MKKIILLVILILTQYLHSQSCSSITATDLLGNTSAQLSCATNTCVGLTTSAPKTYSTTSYQLTSQTPPVIQFDQGTPLNANSDDTFSDVIPLPFNFCFYGNTYDKLVVSTNGFITFDATQTGNSNPNILANNPSALLPKNSIFGLMQDLIFSNTNDSEIYYSVSGTAPCRKFVINFFKGRITGCPTDTSSFQIALSEFSNEIDITVENKPLPCATARFKESLIGIMNASGNNGLSPPGRNRGTWQTSNESWKFSPNGAEITPNYTWKNTSNAVVGSKATINVCPTKTEKYTVIVDYSVCGNNYTLSDDIDVLYSPSGSVPIVNSPVNFPSLSPAPYTICDNNADNTENFDFKTLITPLITTDLTMDVRYYETQAAAIAGGGGLKSVKEGQYILYARVTNTTGCYAIAIVNMDIKFLKKIEAKDIKKIYCFNGTDDITIYLDLLYPEMLITPITEITNVSFYTTYADAFVPNISEAIPPPHEPIIEDDGDLIIYNYFVRFENADGCFTVKKITIELRNPIANQTQNICDANNDETEDILLSNLNGAIAGGQPVTVSYTDKNNNPITTFTLTKANSPAIIYVRLDMEAYNGDCFPVYPVTLNLISSPILTKENLPVNLGTICDHNNDGSEIYDLTQHQTDIYSGTKLYAYHYYENYNLTNEITDPANFSITKSTEVYVKVSSGACFSVAKIVINFNFLAAVKIKSGTVAKCDKEYSNNIDFNLDDAIQSMFISSPNGDNLADINVTYYKTENDAKLGELLLQEPNIVNPQVDSLPYWARFESKNTHCFSVAPIVLITFYPPKAKQARIEYCDGNLDGNPEVNLLLPEYTAKMTFTPSDLNNLFNFYLNEDDLAHNKPIPNPETFSPIPFPTSIFFTVENTLGCNILPLEFSTINFKPEMILPVMKDNFPLDQCDEGNDGKETLDLIQFENQIYTTGASYSYYPTLSDLNKGENKIATPSSYPYDKKVHPPVIFVKTEGTAYCPALVKININLKESPIFELPMSPYYFCPDVGIRIEPDLSYLKPQTYIWKDPSGNIITQGQNATYIDVKTEGQYSLTIINDLNCPYTKYFDVIAYEVPIITQLIGIGKTSYQVIATGSRKIVYSKDGINWQTSNLFENIKPGPVTFYVRFEDSDCLGKTKDGLSVKFANVITPNDDGVNDTWSFTDLDVFKDTPSNLKIYDRNGLLVFEKSSTDNFIWDGKYNGRVLPTSSYWYIMTLPDREIDGWILLKNRN